MHSGCSELKFKKGREELANKKFAVSPGFQEGGTLFKPEQLAVLGSIVGSDAKIEMTTFNQQDFTQRI
jgi:hypothetical protein